MLVENNKKFRAAGAASALLHVRVFIQQEHGNKMCRQALVGLISALTERRQAERTHAQKCTRQVGFARGKLTKV